MSRRGSPARFEANVAVGVPFTHFLALQRALAKTVSRSLRLISEEALNRRRSFRWSSRQGSSSEGLGVSSDGALLSSSRGSVRYSVTRYSDRVPTQLLTPRRTEAPTASSRPSFSIVDIRNLRDLPVFSKWIPNFDAIAEGNLQPSVEVLLNWLPKYSNFFAPGNTANVTAEARFDGFIGMLQTFSADDRYQWDQLECIGDLVASDILAVIMRHYKGLENMEHDTVMRLRDLAFEFFRVRSSREMREEQWRRSRERIAENWAVVLQWISIVDFEAVATRFDTIMNSPETQRNPEDAAAFYHGMRYVRVDVTTAAGVNSTNKFLDELLNQVEHFKKDRIRVAQLECFDNVLQQINFTVTSTLDMSSLWAKIQLFYRHALQWSKFTDLKGKSLHIIATILVRSLPRFYTDNIDLFLEKRILGNVSTAGKAEYCLNVLSHLLRGGYAPLFVPWGSKMPEGPKTSPYSYVMRENESPDTSKKRLVAITDAVFQKKIPNVMQHVDTLVDILVQTAAQSLEYTVNEVLFPLFKPTKGKPDPAYYLIGLRALRKMLDGDTGFMKYSASHNQSEAGAIAENAASHLVSLMRICSNKVGLKVFGKSQHYHQFTSFIKRMEDLAKVDDFLHRGKIPEDESLLRSESTTARKPSDALLYSTARSKGTDEVANEVGTMHEHEEQAARQDIRLHLDVFDAILQAVPWILPSEFIAPDSDVFIGQILLHVDERSAQQASHAFQRIFTDRPALRNRVMRALCHLLTMKDFQETLHIFIILENIEVLCEVWQEACLVENRYDVLDKDILPLLESTVLFGFCQPNVSVRRLAQRLLATIKELAHAARVPPRPESLQTIMQEHAVEIVRKGLRKYSLKFTYGMETNEVMEDPLNPPTLSNVLEMRTGEWTYCLGELGRTCVSEHADMMLGFLRRTILGSLSAMRPWPNAKGADEKYAQRCLNLHVILMATAGCETPTDNEVSEEPTEDDVTATGGGRNYIQHTLLNYLTELWPFLAPSLSKELEWLKQAIIGGCANAHWHAVPSLVNTLHAWFAQGVEKKLTKKTEDLYGLVARLFRLITQVEGFNIAVRANSSLVATFLDFISTSEGLLFPGFTVSLMSYYIDHALIVRHLAAALYVPTSVFYRGAIRKMLKSSTPYAWAMDLRATTVGLLLQWTGEGVAARDHCKAEQEVIHKLRMKEPDSRETVLEWRLNLLHQASQEAVENIVRLDELPKPTDLEWYVSMEKQGHRMLRWILSYDFRAMLPSFVQAAHCKHDRSEVFFHAICDQVLPLYIPPLPAGVNMAVDRDLPRVTFYPHKAEDSVTEVDRDFEASVTEFASSFLFLGLVNLMSTSPDMRERAFDLLHFIVPNLAHDYTVEDASGDLVLVKCTRADCSTVLARYKAGIGADSPSMNRESAMHLSGWCSRVCGRLTIDIFNQLFTYFRTLTKQQQQWTAMWIEPWCFNVNSDPRALGLLLDRIAENVNIARDNMAFSRVITLHLFRQHAEKVVHHLVGLLPLQDTDSDKQCGPEDQSDVRLLRTGVATESEERHAIRTISVTDSEVAVLGGRKGKGKGRGKGKEREKGKGKEKEKRGEQHHTDLSLGRGNVLLGPARKLPDPTPGRFSGVFEPVPPTQGSELEAGTMQIPKLQTMRVLPSIRESPSVQLRRSVVLDLLVDLLNDNVDALLPRYVSYLLTYALLRLNTSETDPRTLPAAQVSESRQLRIILKKIFEAILLKDPRKGEDREESDLFAIYSLLEKLLDKNNIPIAWDTDAESVHFSESSILLSTNPFSTNVDLLIRMIMRSGFIPAVEFVQVIKQFLERLAPTVPREWGGVALRVALECKEEYAMKALQVYRRMGTPVNEDTVLALIQLLDMPLTDADWKGSSSSCLFVTEIVHALQASAEVFGEQGKLHINPALFWVGVAMLRGRDSPLYEDGVRLLSTILSYSSFSSQLNKTARGREEFTTYVDTWEPKFTGVLPLLLEGMSDPKLLSASRNVCCLLSKLCTTSLASVVSERGERLLILLLMVLPSLYNDLVKDGLSEEIRKLCGIMAGPLGGVTARGGQLLQQCAEGQRIENQVFLDRFCAALAAEYFPDKAKIAADVLSDLFSDGIPEIQAAVLHVTASFLKTEQSDTWLASFSSIFALACTLFEKDSPLPEFGAHLLGEVVMKSLERGDYGYMMPTTQPLSVERLDKLSLFEDRLYASLHAVVEHEGNRLRGDVTH